MDSFELNKIFGAVLGTLVFVMGIGFLAEGIYAPIEENGPGYTLPEPEGDGHSAVAAAVVETIPLPVLLASASAAKGEKVAKKCASCHTFEQGGANKIGPALYGIVDKLIGSADGFGYSEALTTLKGENADWTYANLDAFLQSPKKFAPGTKMGFAGLRSEKDRADILAYLQSLSDAPVAFPAVEETPMAEKPMAEDGHAEAKHGEDAHAEKPAAH